MMTVTAIFLDSVSLSASNGQYGLVSMNQTGYYGQRFNEKYLHKDMLVEELQNRLNNVAQELVMLPENADRVALSASWQTLNDLLIDIKAL